MPAAIPNRRATQLRIDETIFEKSKIIAAEEKRTLNSQFEYFIKLGVEAYEAQHGPVILPDETPDRT